MVLFFIGAFVGLLLGLYFGLKYKEHEILEEIKLRTDWEAVAKEMFLKFRSEEMIQKKNM